MDRFVETAFHFVLRNSKPLLLGYVLFLIMIGVISYKGSRDSFNGKWDRVSRFFRQLSSGLLIASFGALFAEVAILLVMAMQYFHFSLFKFS